MDGVPQDEIVRRQMGPPEPLGGRRASPARERRPGMPEIDVRSQTLSLDWNYLLNEANIHDFKAELDQRLDRHGAFENPLFVSSASYQIPINPARPFHAGTLVHQRTSQSAPTSSAQAYQNVNDRAPQTATSSQPVNQPEIGSTNTSFASESNFALPQPASTSQVRHSNPISFTASDVNGERALPQNRGAYPSASSPAYGRPPAPGTTSTARTVFAPTAQGPHNKGSDNRVAVPGNGYADDLAGRPPIETLPPQHIELGAIEILTFCPRWLHHPDPILRLFKAGWTRTDIAKVQLHAINQLDYGNMYKVTQRIQKQLGFAGKLKCGLDQNTRWDNDTYLAQIPAYDDLTADAWQTRHDLDPTMREVEFEDYELADIAAPIVQSGRWPQGQDRLLFTQCLEYASRLPNRHLTTADCGRIVRDQGFTAPGPLNSNHDKQALQRFSNAVPTPPKPAKTR